MLASVTQANDGATIWVCVPNLITATEVRTAAGRVWVDPRARLGKGLGRVIVHEMVHLADPGLEHAKSGVTSPKLSRDQLVDTQCHLVGDAQQALRQAATRWQEQPEDADLRVSDLSR